MEKTHKCFELNEVKQQRAEERSINLHLLFDKASHRAKDVEMSTNSKMTMKNQTWMTLFKEHWMRTNQFKTNLINRETKFYPDSNQTQVTNSQNLK